MRPYELIARVALVVGSVVVTLVGLELGCRVWRGPQWLLHWPNIVWQQRRNMPAEWPVCAYVYDGTVGWAPNPNFKSALYNVETDGLRQLPRLPTLLEGQPSVLATGDSFTEGDEVADDETWPAYLQTALSRRTLNAGVGGFGLDQTVLRTEQMVKLHRVGVAVVGFIVDDLRRMELSRSWDIDKSFFELQSGELHLRNSPVPPPRANCNSLPFWQRTFGWSVLIDGMARRLGLMVDWLFDDVQALPSGIGRELACPVIQRLSRLGVPVLFIAQYDRQAWVNGDAYREQQHGEAKRVLACAAQARLEIFDTYDVVRQAIAERGIDNVYRISHHTPEANRLIAQVIAGELVSRKLLPRTD